VPTIILAKLIHGFPFQSLKCRANAVYQHTTQFFFGGFLRYANQVVGTVQGRVWLVFQANNERCISQ